MYLKAEKLVARLTDTLKNCQPSDTPVKIEGNWGSFARLLASHISQSLKRPILFITPHIDDADSASDDLHTFAQKPIQLLPAWETEPEFTDATDEIGGERLKLVLRLANDPSQSDLIISASIQSLCQPVPKPASLAANCFNLQVNQTVAQDKLLTWLSDNDFERVDRIDMPGQFAHRGGIIDIYAPLAQNETTCTTAIRIEFFGDQIESIRTIDLDTQRSSRNIEAVSIIPPAMPKAAGQNDLLLNLLDPKTIIILEEPSDIQEVAKVFLERIADSAGLYSWNTIAQSLAKFTQLHIHRFAPTTKNEFLKLDIRSVQQFEQSRVPLAAGSKNALTELLNQARTGKKVLLYCESAAEQQRLTEMITQQGPTPPNLEMPLGFIHQGFIVESLNTIFISHHELLGQFAIRRRIRAIRAQGTLQSFLDLEPGDYVVHVTHGIAKFRGIKTLEKDGKFSEYLSLEYANKTFIHVPVQNIALVQKYVGTMRKRPQLSTIGSKKWQNQKQKAFAAVQDLASELIELQAKRNAVGGIAYNPDSAWQKEFEDLFLYQPTPDQVNTAAQIKADMQKPVPMDRLLCGDVGYGKTELAMRAAFKAVENGKQVAVLVPTTVLCVQHGRTFTERFADFPFTIEALNRFKTKSQAKDIITRAKAGKVDILIGTHRILSEDVGFKDLGLVIIDEEQRFGVEHKERLKKFRANVDVLTMTATPIPRTLHMSLLGLRDISSLSTPPLDRRAITTTLTRYDNELIKRCILREMNRGGQAFFLHNRVHSIHRQADDIQAIVPDARITIAHGQMTKSQLEKAMLEFVLGKIDVLVCTTIIESGLDIPNANTIMINNADRFGLAELHQLRGRVGRYKHRAFAYMLLPPDRPISPIAAKRLKAIEEYSELGAGFRIALRDLEIRGAGNILGPEQSGHIHAIGYEMYCKLLAEAVARLRNQPLEKPPTAVIDLGFTTYIPKSYIPSDRQRMDAYRQISSAANEKDLASVYKDLADLFGPVPTQVGLMIDLADIRLRADRKNIKSIFVSDNDVIFTFDKIDKITDLFAKSPGSVRIPDPKTVHVRLEKNYFAPQTLIPILRKILR